MTDVVRQVLARIELWSGDPADVHTAADDASEAFTARLRAARPRWMRDAACRGVDVDVFFPGRGQSAEPARAICATCQVVEDCKRWALDYPDDAGIAAGMSSRQRRAERARRRNGAGDRT